MSEPFRILVAAGLSGLLGFSACSDPVPCGDGIGGGGVGSTTDCIEQDGSTDGSSSDVRSDTDSASTTDGSADANPDATGDVTVVGDGSVEAALDAGPFDAGTCATAGCSANADCTQSSGMAPVCTCKPDFSGDGKTCTKIDDCAGSPCQNGGVCSDLVNDYSCACAPGYDGKTCNNNVNDCAGDPCVNGGVCSDLVNDYSCACAPGYDGKTCSNNINECAGNPCVNGGVCSDLVNDYSCACAPGYDGKTCSNNINDCAVNPCQNGGACNDGVNAFTCTCALGYSGTTCGTAAGFSTDSNTLALFEFTNNLLDTSGNGRHMTEVGAPLNYESAPFGKGLRLTTLAKQGGDWSAYAPLLTHPHTVEFLLVTTGVNTSYQRLFTFNAANDNGWYLQGETFRSYPSANIGSVPDKTWHYVALVSTSPTDMDVYIDGSFVASTPKQFTAPPTEALFFLDDGSGELFDGTVDALRISGSARGAVEITATWNSLNAKLPIFAESFSTMSGGGSGTQCMSGRTVLHSTNVSGWTKGGLNAIHGVEMAPREYAATFYNDNSIAMNAGVAANTNGKTYEVRFRSGPSVWNACGQATTAPDGLVIDVLRPDNSVLRTFTYLPGAWAGSQTFSPGSFTYVGDGTGVVRLRVTTNNSGNGRFGGAIDDLEIYPQ